MIARRALVVLLSLSLVIEIIFTVAGFFAPGETLKAFGVTDTPDARFLGHVIAWMLALITLVCGLALRLVLQRNGVGWTMTYLLGAWWIGIGLALAFGWGQTPNLFIDTLKGTLLVIAAAMSRPRPPSS